MAFLPIYKNRGGDILCMMSVRPPGFLRGGLTLQTGRAVMKKTAEFL